MGRYDLPAHIRKIKEVTNVDKITYIGYSQGTEMMIYGLGTMYEYYQSVFRDVILLAPCIYEEGTHETLVTDYLDLYNAGIYAIGDKNWP